MADDQLQSNKTVMISNTDTKKRGSFRRLLAIVRTYIVAVCAFYVRGGLIF
jgi:hypothetical protein